MINQKEYEILKDLDDRLGWLARDKDGDLVAYEKKPEKSTSFWFDDGRMVNLGLIFDDGRLFQFIQWKDEGPYNIAELIEEYEKNQAYEMFNRQFENLYEIIESEEKEVKKNKEWAQKEVDRYLSYEGVNEARNALVFAKGVIDQLEEPEVLSQELPVLPKHVAEYLDFAKSDVSLMRVMELAHTRYELPKWEKEYDWISANDEIFARAWLDGFTVEKEQKYRVLDGNITLLGRINGFMLTTVEILEYYPEYTPTFDFTEQEIKDYKEGYWAFAVPVEEVGE